MNTTKILDCTLRDGGYYTQWDFNPKLVEKYVATMGNLPIDYLEIGYRNYPANEYFGEYFYLPERTIKSISDVIGNGKIAVMLNEKDCHANTVTELIKPVRQHIGMVRIAVDLNRLENALLLTKQIKELGLKAAINIMYLSKLDNSDPLLKKLATVKDVDYLYIVDSYGGMYPVDVRSKIQVIRSLTDVPLGFHSHNNLELAFVNTLTALEEKIDIIDSTIMGMGRGAGNLKTELLLVHLYAKHGINIDLTQLADLLSDFDGLQKIYEWGTNHPYMLSGAFSLPQKDVMEWMDKKRYSINSIVQALVNQKDKVSDNESFNKLETNKESGLKKGSKVVIVGGGRQVSMHKVQLHDFLVRNPDVIVVHSSTRNLIELAGVPNEQVLCLTGNEGSKLTSLLGEIPRDSISCFVLPPYPRKMGTYVPAGLKSCTYELGKINFVEEYADSPLAMSLQIAQNIDAEKVYITGFDGYDRPTGSEKELEAENQEIMSGFVASGKAIVSITPSKYKNISFQSIYSL